MLMFYLHSTPVGCIPNSMSITFVCHAMGGWFVLIGDTRSMPHNVCAFLVSERLVARSGAPDPDGCVALWRWLVP